MGLPEKPSDEVDGALGQPLEAANDEGIFRPVFSTLAARSVRTFLHRFSSASLRIPALTGVAS